MTLYAFGKDALEPLELISFSEEKITERGDLQRLLRKRIDALDSDLLVVAEEYSLFAESNRRIDLLAVDHSGSLVVVELKRTADGGHMELQALRYAAMISTMSLEQLVDAYTHYNKVDIEEARTALDDWFAGSVEDDLPGTVRIMLVSADFSNEITSTVLWLTQQYALDISCHRLVAYRHGVDVLLDVQQIIPLPEASDFQVKQRQKGAAAAVARASNRNYQKYDVTIHGRVHRGLSKQAALKTAVRELYADQRPLADIRAALLPQRWLVVERDPDASLEGAFHAKYPSRGDGYWFDLDLTDDEGSWVMPRMGGRRVEELLQSLVRSFGDPDGLTWARAED